MRLQWYLLSEDPSALAQVLGAQWQLSMNPVQGLETVTEGNALYLVSLRWVIEVYAALRFLQSISLYFDAHARTEDRTSELSM